MLMQRARPNRSNMTRTNAVAGDWSFNCKNSVYVWTREDYAALAKAAKDLNTSPEDLLLVMELESYLNPHRAFCNKNGYPDAIGLNQITKVNAGAMRISEEERLSLLNMTAAEQMPYVVRSFLAARGYKPFPEPPDAVTLYQTNIAPATVPRETVYKQGVFPCHQPGDGKDPYCNNPGLDYNKDGVITRDDLAKILEKISERPRYKKAVEEFHSFVGEEKSSDNVDVDGYQEPQKISPALILGGLAAGVWLLFKGLKPS